MASLRCRYLPLWPEKQGQKQSHTLRFRHVNVSQNAKCDYFDMRKTAPYPTRKRNGHSIYHTVMRIALVLLVFQNTLNDGGMPFRLAHWSGNSILGKMLGNIIRRFPGKEFTVDPADNDGFLLHDLHIAEFGTAPVSEEVGVRKGFRSQYLTSKALILCLFGGVGPREIFFYNIKISRNIDSPWERGKA